jgi:hydroxymethylglutaryl-CoA lyase
MTPIEIVDVAPRDGLQNERRTLPTSAKVALVRRLLDAGVTRVEAVSFAHPKHVPQVADAEAVLEGVGRRAGVELSGLVLNPRGMDRAVGCGIAAINYVVLCTETFSQRNQHMSVDASIAAWLEIAATAHAAGIRPFVTLSAAFGCPFEGEVPAETVLRVAERVLAGAPAEVVLADTIGVGVPAQVRELVAGCRALAPETVLRGHFHDSRHTGLANALAAIEAGVQVLDASAGGIGGCPFAPGASGNIATEDLAYVLARSGLASGIDAAAMTETGVWIAHELGLEAPPGAIGRAGWFGTAA